MLEDDFYLRPLAVQEWDEVARLIHDSTNAWYLQRGKPPIFPEGPQTTRLFCEVYESLDPGCCVVAEDTQTGRLAGSCFYHPRATHVSLGIMNVRPECFGRGVARRLLRHVTDHADLLHLPTRLVSSALNLDSYSLYNRGGFVPESIYQDMLLTIPQRGLADFDRPPLASQVRVATRDDIPAMVRLEREVSGLNREQDYRYFIENALGIWQTYVLGLPNGELTGFVSSVRHAASRMIGPGVMRRVEEASALVHAALESFQGESVLVLAPASATELVRSLYAWGARNCELHVAQVRGQPVSLKGIVIPTFMPETG